MKFFSTNWLWILAVVIAIHVITALNKGYYYRDQYLSNEQYHFLMDKAEPRFKKILVLNSHVTYYRSFSESLPNIFYAIYLLMLIGLIIIFKKQGIKKVKEPMLVTRSQAIEMSKELLAESILSTKKS